MAEILYLIDGHATLYRAYYAIKTRMAAPGTGRPTHAAFGFTKIVRALLREGEPTCLAVAMDSPGPTFRHKIYDRYKESRRAMPADLVPQIEMVERICEGYGIPVYRVDGFEADDVLGTLARQARAGGAEVVLVSGDKDVLQLVGDGVVAYDPQKGRRVDAAGVEKERGVPPEKLIDLFGLQGDTSDDIPGVPGIGPKTAGELMKKYGSLEAVIEAAKAGKEKGKRRENLVKHEELAKLSRVLATIRTDAPVRLDLARCRVGRTDDEKLIAVFQELGFRDFLSTVAPTGRKEKGLEYRTVDTPAELEAFAKELRTQGRFALDLETDSVRPRQANVVGLSFSWKEKEAAYLPVMGPAGERVLDEPAVLDALRPVLEDASRLKVGQNAKFDVLVLRRAGVEVKGLDFDTMVASYLLDPGSRAHNLDALALQHLGFRKIATEEVIGKGKGQTTMDRVPVATVARYACEDADITWRLAGLLGRKLDEGGLMELFRDLEMPLVEVLAEMEWNGVRVASDALANLSEGMASNLAAEEEAIFEAAGRRFNVASPKQLNEVLYGDLGLKPVKTTPTGAPSTDSDVLEELGRHHALPRMIVKYRQLAKLKSTYADSLPQFVNPETGKIHASFNQAVTATGRLSSSDPNLQNIPVRTGDGRAIRQCFVPGGDGWRFLSADYSQIELRILAHMSADARLVRAFREGRDIHASVAAELGGVPVESVTEEARRRAKTVNFGLMYGQGAQHLARSTGMTVREADEFISRYFRTFSGVQDLRRKVIEDARRDGFVKTMLGRIRYLPEIASEDVASRRAAERMAFNTVIQGTAADLMKRAMVDVLKAMRAAGTRSRMLLQVHDELLFECPPEELAAMKKLAAEKMSGALRLDVPLVVDAGVGDNWLDLEYS